MEEEQMKFSSRARQICRESDPSQPVHFLSRRKWGNGSEFSCSICGYRKGHSNYYLHCDTCDYDVHKNCYLRPICRLSELTKPHSLRVKYGRLNICFTCGPCGGPGWEDGSSFFSCNTCKENFHEGCHLYPPKINHPFHSLHPLTLTFSLDSYHRVPTSWQHEPSDSETEESEASDDDSISDVRCKCCQKRLQHPYYHCSICKFSLNLKCTRNPPPLTLSNLRSHDHILTLFPRRIHSPCDACGSSLDNTHDLVYACNPCNYMVHWTCIYLPRVIKITRHPHRLSITPSLPSGLFRCGVCRLTINVTYGQFSCQKEECHYALHSRCAVEGRVWDGKDLEGVPEEPEEDLDPFVRIDDETIKHFSHEEHCLIFHGNNDVCDEDKFCQACIIPILVSESFYGCMPCNFLLHEACASLPRKKDHPLHKHRLILHPIPTEPIEFGQIQRKPGKDDHPYRHSIEGMLKCNGCDQVGHGFLYSCSEKDCKFQLDVRCASLPDPFIHRSHPHHELFFNLTKGKCMGCKSTNCSPYFLECMECKLFLGLKCATLPNVTHYKHDRHPLALCYGEENTNGQYWCEICETRLDAKEWFYGCNDYCNVTVHVSCFLGKQIFLKPAFVQVNGYSVSILRNNDATRAVCCKCERLCVEPFLFILDSYKYLNLCCIDCACWETWDD